MHILAIVVVVLVVWVLLASGSSAASSSDKATPPPPPRPTPPPRVPPPPISPRPAFSRSVPRRPEGCQPSCASSPQSGTHGGWDDDDPAERPRVVYSPQGKPLVMSESSARRYERDLQNYDPMIYGDDDDD